MKHRWFLSVVIMASVIGTMFIVSCSKDDTTNGPNSSDHQVNIKFYAGSQFTYNRWDLDPSNAKIQSTLRSYRIDMKKGYPLLLGPYQDWFYRIGVDNVSQKKDTLYVRTETKTKTDNSSYTKEVQIYGFTTKLFRTFIDTLNSKIALGTPTIPSEQWDPIARYYDDGGSAIAVGTEWYLVSAGSENGFPLNFSYLGQPVTVMAKIKCKYEGKEEKITVGTKDVLTWRTSITATFSAATLGVNIVMGFSMSFSDDPSGQIKVQQNSVSATVVMVPLSSAGEVQELTAYQ
jgi:hypothetical protein